MSDESRLAAERELRDALAAFMQAMERAMLEGVDVMSVMMAAGMPLPPMPFPDTAAAESDSGPVPNPFVASGL